jgi:hypothetical protein
MATEALLWDTGQLTATEAVLIVLSGDGGSGGVVRRRAKAV